MPSAPLEEALEELLAEGIGDGETLAEIGRLGARLVLQRALDEEEAESLNRGGPNGRRPPKTGATGSGPEGSRPGKASLRSRYPICAMPPSSSSPRSFPTA
jgi:hypothetical protein